MTYDQALSRRDIISKTLQNRKGIKYTNLVKDVIDPSINYMTLLPSTLNEMTKIDDVNGIIRPIILIVGRDTMVNMMFNYFCHDKCS